MGEAIWTRVTFRTPKGWGVANDLVDGLSAALINGDSLIDNDEVADDHYEWTISGEGNYGLNDGEVEYWLDWMRQHKVPFIANDEPKYEFQGTTIVFTGEREWAGESSSEQAVMSRSTYASIIGGTSQFRTVDEFFRILNTRTTGGFSIDHLPDKFPSDDDALCEFDVPIPGTTSTNVAGGILRGTRDDLLLLARNIHDALEGSDHDRDSSR